MIEKFLCIMKRTLNIVMESFHCIITVYMLNICSTLNISPLWSFHNFILVSFVVSYVMIVLFGTLISIFHLLCNSKLEYQCVKPNHINEWQQLFLLYFFFYHLFIINLSFRRRKTRRPLPQSKDEKLTAILIQGTTIQNGPGIGLTEGVNIEYVSHPPRFFVPVSTLFN